MKLDNLLIIVVSCVLGVTSLIRTIKDLYDKTIKGKLGFVSNYGVSLLAGFMMFTLVSLYTENMKLLILAACTGSWGGSNSLDLISDFIKNKFNLKKNEEN